jgi:hypothetical protein
VSRVVGSDNKECLEPLLESNILPHSLTRLAMCTRAVVSTAESQGYQSKW